MWGRQCKEKLIVSYLIYKRVLRGPATILFISCDACSDSITKLVVLVFMGYRTIIAQYVAKRGVAQMCLCETQHQGGASHHLNFGGSANLPEMVSRDMGYCGDSIALSHDMGPLSVSTHMAAEKMSKDEQQRRRASAFALLCLFSAVSACFYAFSRFRIFRVTLGLSFSGGSSMAFFCGPS